MITDTQVLTLDSLYMRRNCEHTPKDESPCLPE